MTLTPPTPEQLNRIFQDINLNKDQHQKDTKALKEWLKCQPHLPHDLDDTILASIIVGCKNNMERSKKILDAYLTNRTSCPDFYRNRDPCDETYRRLGRLVRYFVLPGMTPEGYRVSVYCMRSPDVSSTDFDLTMNAIKVLSSFDVRFLEDTYCAGDIMILDCKHFGIKHLQSVSSISLLRKYTHCCNESLPVRYKKIIFINLPSLAEPIIAILKMILKDKIVQRMITTTEDYPFLYNHIPKDLLPEEYGGKAGKFDDINDAWQLKVESHQDWFLKDMKRKVDEKKRPKKNEFKNKNNVGVEGSFRTLRID